MKLRVVRVGEGPGPKEVIVSVETSSGETEQLILDVRSLSGSYVDVGYPIDRDNRNYLVELPRETTRGAWRVWVPETALVPPEAAE